MPHALYRRCVLAFALLLAVAVPSPVSGQSAAERIKAKAQERANKKVDDTADKTLDKFGGAFACVVGDEECPKRAKAKGKKVVLTDADGTVLPPDEQPADSPAKKQPAATAAASVGEPAPAPGAGGRPGEGAWSNYDFIPGERVMWAESFASDRVGNFPQRLELINGNMEVVEWRGSRWLRVTASGSSNFAITLPEKLPPRFTMEFDLTIPWNGVGLYSAVTADRGGSINSTRASGYVHLSGTVAGAMRAMSDEGSVVDPRTIIDEMYKDGATISEPVRVRIEVDGAYMKVYFGEKRIANLPNGNFGRTNKIFFEFSETGDESGRPFLGNISVNAGGKKLYDALLADGHVATQGILFDVGSDKLRGESTPTLQEIGAMLKEHADLKLTIEGHTDNTGSAATNQTLSQKRAESIVSYLTATYGISAARLVPKGFGASKPAGTNDTPEGRQANRRVELVKM